MSASTSPLPYTGNKSCIANTIFDVMPKHTVYIEPCMGSAETFFRKARAEKEILNDYNGDLVNLFRVIQSNEKLAFLIGRLYLSVNSEQIFRMNKALLREVPNVLDDIWETCSLFTTVPVRLYSLSVSLQGSMTAGLTGYGTSIGDVANEIVTELSAVESLADLTTGSFMGFGSITSPIMYLFCIILMAYAVIKVFFANLKRGGILLIQIAVGSLYMFSIPRGYIDGFVQWIKQVIGLCLTAFLQSTILVAGLMVFKDHALLGIGLMLSAGEVPRIAGTFGLDTTTRANIMSAVYTAQAAVNTTQTVAKAVTK